jgi:ribosomal protein S18 acetylase RimI-like enzyme
MILPRVYHDECDFTAMHDVLTRGRQAANGSYYIHTGDLKWWLYYPPLEGDFWEHIHLWDGSEQPGRFLGWALISSGGQVAAFSIIWADQVNQDWLFESVGTHPDFQRRGLGSAVMLEGLHMLKRLGMKQAIVSTGEDNRPGRRLYKTVGSQVISSLRTYEKDV